MFCLTCTADEISFVLEEKHLGYFEVLSLNEPSYVGRPRGNEDPNLSFEHRDTSPSFDSVRDEKDLAPLDGSFEASEDKWIAFQVYVGMGGLGAFCPPLFGVFVVFVVDAFCCLGSIRSC